MSQNHQTSIEIKDLPKILEPLIRRVVREELNRIAQSEPGIFILGPDMPLYDDMQDLNHRKGQGKIELHSHKEVWGE
jgi:hypothetical protein